MIRSFEAANVLVLLVNGPTEIIENLTSAEENKVCNVSTRSDKKDMIIYTWSRGDTVMDRRTKSISLTPPESQTESLICHASLANYGNCFIVLFCI